MKRRKNPSRTVRVRYRRGVTRHADTFHADAFWFALKFGALFAALYGAFEWARGTPFVESLIHGGILSATAGLIDWMSPAEAVRVVDHSLVSSGSRLHVTRGCEGVEMFMLLTAGILAFPASGRHRARGFSIGAALVYALTLARLGALHFTLRYRPGAWDQLHGLILPLGPVVLVALYFLHWSGAGTRSDPVVNAN